MPDRKAYEASTLNMARIFAYAKRVAKETRKPMEADIAYTTTEYKTVARQVEVKGGLLNMFARLETQSERVLENRRVEVVGPHWVVERRHHHIRHTTKGRNFTHEETHHEQYYAILLPDGGLKMVVLMEEENFHNEIGKGGLFSTQRHSVNDLSVSEVGAMDFEKRYYESRTDRWGHKNWGDREPGKRLLTHAKGVGLTQSLKLLLR
jgi:hypothetical protein